MQFKKIYTWNIVPDSAPFYIRRCKKCNKTTKHYCSEKFRLNAQKKLIDVWLIYKCCNCDSTFNIDILPRVNVNSIDKDLFSRFTENDIKTSWIYAFDREVMSRNKINVDYSNINFKISGDEITFKQIIESEEDIVEINLNQEFDVDVKLTDIIKNHFLLSTDGLDKLLSSGALSVYPPGPVKKKMLIGENTIIIIIKNLRKCINENLMQDDYII